MQSHFGSGGQASGGLGAMAHKSNPYKKATHPVKSRKCFVAASGSRSRPVVMLEGSLEVSLEVEEEAHAPIAKEAPKDAPALEVKRR